MTEEWHKALLRDVESLGGISTRPGHGMWMSNNDVSVRVQPHDPKTWARMTKIARDHGLMSPEQVARIALALAHSRHDVLSSTAESAPSGERSQSVADDRTDGAILSATGRALRAGDPTAWRAMLGPPITLDFTFKMKRAADTEPAVDCRFDQLRPDASRTLSLLADIGADAGEVATGVKTPAALRNHPYRVASASLGTHIVFGGVSFVPAERDHKSAPTSAAIAGDEPSFVDLPSAESGHPAKAEDVVRGTETEDGGVTLADIESGAVEVDEVTRRFLEFMTEHRARTELPEEHSERTKRRRRHVPRPTPVKREIHSNERFSGSVPGLVWNLARVGKETDGVDGTMLSGGDLGVLWSADAEYLIDSGEHYFLRLSLEPSSLRQDWPVTLSVRQARDLWSAKIADNLELRFLPITKDLSKRSYLRVAKQLSRSGPHRWVMGSAIGFRPLTDGRYPDHQLVVVLRPLDASRSCLESSWPNVDSIRTLIAASEPSWEEAADRALCEFIEAEIDLCFDDDDEPGCRPDPGRGEVEAWAEETIQFMLQEEGWGSLGFHLACGECFWAVILESKFEHLRVRRRLGCSICMGTANRAAVKVFRRNLREERVRYLAAKAINARFEDSPS